MSKPRPVPEGARALYNAWLGSKPETFWDLNYFWGFVAVTLRHGKVARDGSWLRERLKIDAPALPDDVVSWYADRFEIVVRYEAAQESDTLKAFARAGENERWDAIRRGELEIGQPFPEAARRAYRARRYAERREDEA